MRATASTKLGITIKGCRFIDLVSDQVGLAELVLPFSPSGCSTIVIQLTTETGHGNSSWSTFEIEWGVPGIRPANEAIRPLQPLRLAEQLVPIDIQPMQREVAIVVPVYNAPEDVERCLDSVLAHTTGLSRLIVIDDASTDTRIAPLLDR
ncbi:MAG: glycosyltransferase, partial [Dokdonella sp.]